MPEQRPRVDRWLWFARFFKTRSLAAKAVTAGHVRLNGQRIAKPAAALGPGDVLTFRQGDRVRIVRIVEMGTRRGPAPEARALYDDLTPPETPRETPVAPVPRFEGKGRPTKKDRRDMIPKGGGLLE